MNIFDFTAEVRQKQGAPLAERMRPRTLQEFFGQGSIVGEGKLLSRLIAADKLVSVIFHGPPGTGKTTLAHIIAEHTRSHFVPLNAVSAGVADVRRVIEGARENLASYGRRTIIFIDEIHRFNKGQQDSLLPAVEKGLLVLIGATTENPYFCVNAPLLSRSRLFRLETLGVPDLKAIALSAMGDKERGLGQMDISIDEGALMHLVHSAAGDARNLLNALEIAALSTTADSAGQVRITMADAENSTQEKVILYDKTGDQHYDIISAFIKSMRGGDPDATLFWLACMVKAGEDPRFIARRIVICAAEDVGNADPRALQLAVSASHAVEFLGMPEGRIPLAQAALYVATAPKSNAAYVGIDEALAALEQPTTFAVPKHLRDSSYQGAKHFGHGQGYLYPHSYPGSIVKQSYLPEGLHEPQFYAPQGNGYEKNILERLAQWRREKGEK